MRNYTLDDVALGRRLVAEIGRHQWALGDLALKVSPEVSQQHVSNGAYAAVDAFAEEIGIEAQSLREYRRVAHAWPRPTRAGQATYTMHRDLSANPRRFELLAGYLAQGGKPSSRGLQAFLGKRPTPEISSANRVEQVRQGLADMDPAERAEVVREALADETVADAALETLGVDRLDWLDEQIERMTPEDAAKIARNAMANPDVADRVMEQQGPHRENAITAVSRAHSREDIGRDRPEPQHDRDEMDELARVTLAFRNVMRGMTSLAEQLQGADVHHRSADVRDGFAALATGLQNRLDIIRGLVEGRSMDDELADLQAGGL